MKLKEGDKILCIKKNVGTLIRKGNVYTFMMYYVDTRGIILKEQSDYVFHPHNFIPLDCEIYNILYKEDYV